MTVSPLDQYLTLEYVMLMVESEDAELAETLHDLMDPLWYELSDAERTYLNERITTTIAWLDNLGILKNRADAQ